jgi:hypothetical protein
MSSIQMPSARRMARQAGRGDRLVQERRAVARQQRARVRVEVLALPLRAAALWLTSPSLWLGRDAAGWVHGCQMISK